MQKILEICCFDLESALIAQDAGADRIELCSSYAEGGLTPSFGMLRLARKWLHVPIHVMVRPRGGNFIYSPLEVHQMMNDIHMIKEEGMEGIVVGCLTNELEPDIPHLEKLLETTSGLDLTFHRAFDQLNDPEKNIPQLIELGFNRILSSGGKSSATEGIQNLKSWNDSWKEKITIMPGGGLRSQNLSLFLNSGFHEVHSSALVKKMDNHQNENFRINAEEIQKLKRMLSEE